jgi:PAS domain S-box-containing protein
VTSTGLTALEEEAGRHRELQAIYEISEAISRAGSIEETCREAVRAVRVALDVPRASLLLTDDAGTMRFCAWHGLSERYRRATEGHSPWAADAVDPRPVMIEDAARDDSLGDLRRVVLDEGIGALAFVPLVASSRLIGKFMLYYDLPHVFSRPELQLTQAIAGYVAVEIERLRIESELRLSRDQLGVVFQAVPEGLTVQDGGGRLVMANDTAARLSGYPSAAAMLDAYPGEYAERFELFQPSGEPLPFDQLPGRRVLAGEEAAEELVRFRIRGSNEERWSEVRSRGIVGDDGSIRLVVNVFRDVTERRRLEQNERFLAGTSSLLAASLDLDETLHRLAMLVVPDFADWCVVHLVDGKKITPRAIAHEDPAMMRWAREISERYAPTIEGRSRVAQVVRSGRPVLVPAVTDSMLRAAAVDDDHLQLLRAGGFASMLVVPIPSGRSPLGAISFLTGRSGRRFTDEDLVVAQELARRAAHALGQARLHAAEREAREAAEKAEQQLAALEQLSLAALRTNAGEDVLPTLLERVRDVLQADRATLLLLDTETDELRIHRAVGLDEETVREVRVPLGAGVAGTIASRGTPMVVADLHGVPVVSRYLREPGGSLAGVPLHLDGRVLGVLEVSDDDRGRFDEDDLELLEAVGERVALILGAAELREREHVMVETLQRSLLPERLPRVKSIAFAAHYQPGGRDVEIGGDWFDAILCEDGSVAFTVGDVVGKGLPAATTMGQLRNALRAYAFIGHGPATALVQLNNLLESFDEPPFTTLFTARLDPTTRLLTYASAGHPPALLLHDGGVTLLDEAQTVPFGAGRGFEPRQASRVLDEGDALLLFTDGLVERRGQGIGAGLARLVDCLKTSFDGAEAIVDRVIDVFLGEATNDDVALLAVQVVPRRFSASVDDPESLQDVRHRFKRWLNGHAAEPDRAAALVLAAWELLTNAVEHPLDRRRAGVTMDAELEGDLARVVVSDAGRWRPPVPGSNRGRGLVLAREIVESFELEQTADGTRATVTQTLRGPAGPAC